MEGLLSAGLLSGIKTVLKETIICFKCTLIEKGISFPGNKL